MTHIIDVISLLLLCCSFAYSVYVSHKSKRLQRRVEELQRHSFVTNKFA